jgi:hypothetical protein
MLYDYDSAYFGLIIQCIKYAIIKNDIENYQRFFQVNEAHHKQIGSYSRFVVGIQKDSKISTS